MRKTAKALVLILISFLGTVALGIASAFSASLAFAATALIVPGTGTHNINPPNAVTGYKENAATRYIDPAGQPVCAAATCLVGVDYPASFFPLVIFPGWCPGLTCDTWNESVDTGVTNLEAALNEQLANPTPDNQQIVIFGYSQGGAVVSRAMYDLDPALQDRVTIVTIGNINNPLGLWSRLSGVPPIPFFDISFNPQLPTDGFTSMNYAFEYDPVGDAPEFWGNPVTMLNALAAFEYVHGYYLSPNSNGPTDTLPYGYDDASLAAAIAAADHRQYQDATFVLIPQQGTLPIFRPFTDIASQLGVSGFVDPLVKLASPLTKLLIDLGYDRVANPGIARPLSILPFNPFAINPITFPVQVVQAIVQGIQDALGGGSMMLAPATTPAPTSLLAARSVAPQVTDEPVEDQSPKATALALVEKSEPEAAPVATVAEPAVAKAEEPAAAEPSKPAEVTAVDEKKADETPVKDEPKRDDVTKEEPKDDTTKAEAKDDTTKAEAKDEAKKADEPKKEEPKKDEPEKKAESEQKAAA
jgi:hypothetical protein